MTARDGAALRLEGRGLVRTFRGGAGLRGVDLTVAPGGIHALVGLNGAGKSTLMRLLLGMLRPDTGEVRLDGVGLGRRIRNLGSRRPARWAPLAYGELTGRGEPRDLGAAARRRARPGRRTGGRRDRGARPRRYAPVRTTAVVG